MEGVEGGGGGGGRLTGMVPISRKSPIVVFLLAQPSLPGEGDIGIR